MNKNPLNQRSNCFTLVLNDSSINCFKSSGFIYNKFICNDDLCVIYIAVIYHDKDYDEEVQQKKTPHYHVVIQFDRNYRVGSVINLVCDLFKGCNENQVSCDKCSSLMMQSRYLIHLDEADKIDYKESEVVTNDIKRFRGFLKAIKTINGANDLIALCKQYKNLLELMSVIGLENYKKYRIAISDIRKELYY